MIDWKEESGVFCCKDLFFCDSGGSMSDLVENRGVIEEGELRIRWQKIGPFELSKIVV